MIRPCSATLMAAMFLVGCHPPPTPPAPPLPAPPQAPRTQGDPNPPRTPPAPPTPPRQDPTPAAPQPPSPTPAEPSPQEVKEKERRSLMQAKFVRLTEATVDKKPFYTIEIDMKNVSDKDMKLFQGGVWFYDESGKDLYLIGDTYGPVKAGETTKRGYSPFNLTDGAVAYMKTHPDKVKVEFEADKVEYADGTTAKYGPR